MPLLFLSDSSLNASSPLLFKVTLPTSASGWHMWGGGGGSLLGRSPSVTWHVKPMCQFDHHFSRYIYNRFIYPDYVIRILLIKWINRHCVQYKQNNSKYILEDELNNKVKRLHINWMYSENNFCNGVNLLNMLPCLWTSGGM